MLPAFDKIATKYSDAVLVTTGKINKNYIVNYKKQKEKMQHKDRIIDLGYVSIEKYNNIIYNSDVLCMTRKNSGYANAGFPFKLAAFLATGNPVIATEVSNITDYLTEEHCYLIKSVSVEKIYNALEKIKSNPIEAKKIGWLGKRVAHQYFNAQKHRIIFFDLIDRIS